MAKAQRQQKPSKLPSTQRYLDIQEIREDVVILKDGSLRAVLLVSSINFDLKSEEEQVAVIQSYTQFLNALNFPLQIVIQSRKFDIDDYLERLKAIEKQQQNELLKLQTASYRNYIAELVELANLMSKRFYAVIPFSPQERKNASFLTKLKEAVSPSAAIHLRQEQFETYKRELFKRVDYVIDGLSTVAGLKSVVLDTQGLIELYYNTYNPQTYDQQPLGEAKQLNIV
jgi:type IV secretory pathway VirB4 component